MDSIKSNHCNDAMSLFLVFLKRWRTIFSRPKCKLRLAISIDWAKYDGNIKAGMTLGLSANSQTEYWSNVF